MSDYVPAFDAFRAGWSAARLRFGLLLPAPGDDEGWIREAWEAFCGLPKVAPVDDELGPDVKRWALDGPVERRELIRLRDQVLERLKEVEGEHAVIRDRQTDDGELLGSLLQQVNRLGKLEGDAQRHAELGRRVAYLEQQIGKEGGAPGELMDRVITLELEDGKTDRPQGDVAHEARIRHLEERVSKLVDAEMRNDAARKGERLSLEAQRWVQRVAQEAADEARDKAIAAALEQVECIAQARRGNPNHAAASLAAELGDVAKQLDPEEIRGLVLLLERVIPAPPGGRRSLRASLDRAERLEKKEAPDA